MIMTKGQVQLTKGLTHLNVAISLGYLLFRYFIKKQTPFGEESYDIQKVFQYLHIMTVPFLVFIFGLIWYVHISPKLASSSKKKLKSGLLLLMLFAGMIGSGYLVQLPFFVGVSLVGVIHSVVGGLWIMIFYYHVYKK